MKVVWNVQDTTITRHTHAHTHIKHTDGEKKRERKKIEVIIVHGHMIKLISVC